MRKALLLPICIFLAAGCPGRPGEKGRTDELEETGPKKGEPPPSTSGKEEGSPGLFFDRFMVELPRGGKILVQPSEEKLKSWGKVSPEAFRKAVTDGILAALEESKKLLLVDLTRLTVTVRTGEDSIEFPIGDYARLSEIESSGTK